MAVRFRLICADKVHSANIGMTKASSHGKGCVIKAKIPQRNTVPHSERESEKHREWWLLTDLL